MVEIYNENCLKTLQERKITFDVVLTSPPYNTSLKRRVWNEGQKTHYDVQSVDKMTDDEYIDFTVELFTLLGQRLNKNGVVLYNISYSTEKPSLIYKVICEIEKNTEFQVVDTIIWKKNCALPNNMNTNRLTRICEFVFVFARKSELKTFVCNKKVKSVDRKGVKKYESISNLVEARNNDGANSLNKATYSSELCEKLLKIYAPKESTVYDPFMGTGTTALACQRLGLDCYGSELSLSQCLYATTRLSQVSVQQSIF